MMVERSNLEFPIAPVSCEGLTRLFVRPALGYRTLPERWLRLQVDKLLSQERL